VKADVVGREPWHKGLTVEDDERVAKLGRSVAASRLIIPVHNKDKTKDDYEPLKRAGENISPVLKRMYADGELQPWSKGLTKFTDPRVAILGQNISKAKAEKIARGEVVPYWYKYTKNGWMFNCSTCEKELFRSSYEASYMNVLNSCGVKWTTIHKMIVRWVDENGFFRCYVPDFKVWIDDNTFEIHEIKSVYMESDEDNQRKFHAAIRKGWREGWEFKVLTEETNPEFKEFDPQQSEWFVDYDEKTWDLIKQFSL
jgi:hypothetical protein